MRLSRFRTSFFVAALVLASPVYVPGLTNREALKLFDRMAEKLCLTVEQRSETFFLLLRHADEVRALLAAEGAAAAALREAITQPVYDEALIWKRVEQKAAAEHETALLAGKLFAALWAKLDLRQQEVVRSYLASTAIPRNELLKGVEAFAGSGDLYLTIKSPSR